MRVRKNLTVRNFLTIMFVKNGEIAMPLIKEICSQYFRYAKRDEAYSPEYIKHSEKCYALYNELEEALDEEQKERLRILDDACLMHAGQCKDDGFNEGLEKGFKLAMRIMMDSMRQ
jgi:hypothetical protein